MHILEQYSLACGLKIGKPYIYEKYFPLPFEKYITFNPFGKFNSRKYSYWQDVIDLISPILQEHNIHIVQIGGNNEPGYNKCFHLMGQTNFNQTAYIINNSLMHFGVDSFPIHIASYYDKKIVGLYSNMYASQSKPYWSKPENIKLIQADLNGKKPSYAPEENPKTIDSIKPEDICNSILNFLNIDQVSFKTGFIGKKYGNLILESIPSAILAADTFPNTLLNIRYDYIKEITEQDYLCTLNNLNIRNCSIITDKAIEIERFLNFKEKLHHIFYDITNTDIDFNFINKTKILGFKLQFVFQKTEDNHEILNNKKLELNDHPEIINLIEFETVSKEIIKNNTFYKNKKIIFANNNVYLSKAAYLQNKPVIIDGNFNFEQSLNDLNNSEELSTEDAEYILFFNK
jgi:hypothetical protein